MSELGSNTFSPALVLFAGFGVAWVVARQLSSRNNRRLPPGPPTWPLVGNVLAFSPKDAYKPLSRYKDLYGDVSMIHGLGTHILVLNTMEVVEDLLVKRGDVFSNRPRLVFAGELVELNNSTPLIQYGTEWRLHRRMMHATMNSTAVGIYHGTQEKLATRMCVEMADEPNNFFEHIYLFSGRVALATVYGIEIPDRHDDFFHDIETGMAIVSEVTVPGAFLVDILPFLKYLPSWVPFHRKAADIRVLFRRNLCTPFSWVRAKMASGTAPPSLARDWLSGEEEHTESYLSLVKWVAGSLYAPASETTSATVIIFIMGMLLNPDAQRKAQAEIEKVVGSSRPPVISDKEDLPYIEAVIKETMRWRPVLPLGLAHCTEGDNTYRGYFIPHDTIVLPNVWSIAHEPNSKYEPASFIPERFLDPTQNIVDPQTYTFGFGRRICPGRALGNNSVFIAVAMILWAFDLSLKPGTTLEPEFSPDLVSRPKPFVCDIKPRSSERINILKKIQLNQ